MAALARPGGGRLVMAADLPVIVNPETLATPEDRTFTGAPFAPLAPDDGLIHLMDGAGSADWDLPYEALERPEAFTRALLGFAEGL